MLTFVFVLRSGGDYRLDHALRLWSAIKVNLNEEARYVLLTDKQSHFSEWDARPLRTQWPGWWAKMELFAPEQADLGEFIYLDLDTAIVGNLDWLKEANGNLMLRDFYFSHHLASGMMRLTPEARAFLWECWIRDPEGWMEAAGRGGDQAFIRNALPVDGTWQDQFPGKVVSYKVHVRGKDLTPEASIVCFHGRPRPWECVKTEPWLAGQFF